MKTIEDFCNQSILVVGDMMVDKYIIGSVERISPEAPVPVLRQTNVRRKLGGAGNVLINVKSLGGRVRAVGRIGDDIEGEYFCKTLSDFGIDGQYMLHEGHTIVKTRVSASNQQFIRIDDEEIVPLCQKTEESVIGQLDSLFQDITVVIISDYGKGFVTEKLAQNIIQTAKVHGIPVLVDPKGKSAAKYRGATAITPNNKEFMDLTGLTRLSNEDDIKSNALRLCSENDYKYIIYTRSEKGISLIDKERNAKFDYPAEVREVIDVTGAGDTVISVIALAMGSGFDLGDCIKTANLAASIVISKFGTAQTTIQELNNVLLPKRRMQDDDCSTIQQIRDLQSKGKKIVFTNGCFDIIHAGHISSFLQARSFGDVLVIGLNSDDSIRRIKGNKRPIVSLENRRALLLALECVDFVISFSEDTPEQLIRKIKPDVLVKGKDWEGKEVAGANFVRSYGGKVEFIDLVHGLSTSSIIEKIKNTI